MKRRNLILIVDDTEMNRAMLADMLAADYEIIEAVDGEEAVAALEEHHKEIALVLMDPVIPKKDGFEVLAVMNQNKWTDRIPVIMISGEASSCIDQAYDLGAADYISRPFDEKAVRRRVHNMIMLYSKQEALEDMVEAQIMEKERINYLMVEILSNIVEFRSGDAGLHAMHIRTLTGIFLKKLMEMTNAYRFTPSQTALIINASALHDIGIISIPESILNKPGKLTPEEYEVIKTHSAAGAHIMEDAMQRHGEELIRYARDICRWHHERYDGGGYPDGLKGEEIPIEVQVVALADVYDALTSVRVYREAYPHEQAMKMILNGECGAFSPLLLDCLRQTGDSLEEKVRDCSDDVVSEAEIRQRFGLMSVCTQASDRTLMLLEQERVKYQFFADMSNEIQFEYNREQDLLTISEWGSEQLGLSILVEHPWLNEEYTAIFSKQDRLDLADRVKAATPLSPIVRGTYCLHLKGEDRWYNVVARPLWDGDDVRKMTGVIGKYVDVHEERLKMERLKDKAEHDSLTGLNNHESARRVIRKMLRHGDKKYAVILLDLDNFKEANDRHGHMFGDQVLLHVAVRIQSSVRVDDIAARVGGDEFLLFLEYDGDVGEIVRRIFTALQGQYQTFETAVSMGIALAPENGLEYDTLFHAADQALYAAKQAGKNQYCFYNNSMNQMLSALSPMDGAFEKISPQGA